VNGLQVLTDVQLAALRALIVVAAAAHHAANESEILHGGEARIGARDFQALSDALDQLDALPDNRPDYVLAGAALAEWHLRDLLPPGG
jgi:hypothetical protein